MADYKKENDGKVHTRYTDLTRCTPGSVDKVALEYLGITERYRPTGGPMNFGTMRHEMWQEEAENTGVTPEVFKEFPCEYQVPATYIEREFATEIFEGVVLHSRPDVFSKPEATIVDYKTSISDYETTVKHYRASKQHLVYAYQMYAHGIRVDKAVYLIEFWDHDYKKIMGYAKVIVPIRVADLMMIRDWLRVRCERLFVTLEWIKYYGT